MAHVVLKGLDVANKAQPYARLTTVEPDTLDIASLAQPFWAIDAEEAAPPGGNMVFISVIGA